MGIKASTFAWAANKYGTVIPWYLRWCLPAERPMLMFVGRRGKGKTAIAVKVSLGRMDHGEKVYANLEIRDRENGRRGGRVFSLLQCLDLEDCTVVIDEANMWTNSRMWQKVPPQILEAWQESRKSAVSFIFTTQHEQRVDLVIRELADFVMICERPAWLPRWVPFFRVMRTHLEDVNEVRRGGIAPAEYYWLKDRVFASYSTRERLGGQQLEAMRAFQDAIKKGQDPDELGLAVPPRREPTIRWRGWWVERYIGGFARAQDAGEGDVGALVAAPGVGRGCTLPPTGAVVFDDRQIFPDYGAWEKVASQAA